MKTKQLLLKITIVVLSVINSAQGAPLVSWNKKTSLATTAGTSCLATTSTGDSVLVGTYDKGIFLSPDGGDSWLHTLAFAADSAIYCISHMYGSTYIAGGNGRMYKSDNNGYTWYALDAPLTYPVRQILYKNQKIYACSADYGPGTEMGDGILQSADSGHTWATVNNGLPVSRAVWRLAADHSGRILAGCSDVNNTGTGGVYYLNNTGSNWQRIPMNINGAGVVFDNINITEVIDLVVTPSDSIICSGNAISGSVLVSGMFKNTTDSALHENKWPISGLWPSASFWLRSPAASIFQLSSYSMLGSYTGGPVTGGPYYSTDNGNTWQRIKDGIDIAGAGYNADAFARGSGERIYMIQEGDNDLYYTDSILTTQIPAIGNRKAIHIFPNPSKNNIYISDLPQSDSIHVYVTDLKGNIVCQTTIAGNQQPIEIKHTLPQGIYTVTCTNNLQKTIVSGIFTVIK